MPAKDSRIAGLTSFARTSDHWYRPWHLACMVAQGLLSCQQIKK